MKSIARQIAFTTLALLAICVAAASLGVYLGVRSMMLDQLDQTLESHAHALASLTNIDSDIIEFEYSAERNTIFEDDDSDAHFNLWIDTSIGTSMHWSSHSEIAAPTVRPGDQPIDSTRYWDAELPDGRPARAISLRFELEHEDLGEEYPETEHHTPDPQNPDMLPIDSAIGNVVVLIDKDPMLHTAAVIRWWLLAMGALLACAIPLVILLSVRRGLRPLHQMNQQIRSIDADSIDRRIECTQMPVELTDSANRINDLLARLSEAFAKEKRFTAAAAHELRTPLAEIRTVAEVALRASTLSVPGTNALEEVVGATIEMESLVTQLLSIARGESKQAAQTITEFDLVALIDKITDKHQPALQAKLIQLDFRAPEPIMIRANHAILVCILSNLVSNIAKYAPPKSRASISCRREQGAVEIQCVNTIESLDTSMADHLFEPFWQADPSRSASGYGLGLAVARTLAQSIPSTLDAHIDDADNKLVFVFRIPIE